MTRNEIRERYCTGRTVKDMLAEIAEAADGISNAPSAEAAERERIIVALAMEATAILHPELAAEF